MNVSCAIFKSNDQHRHGVIMGNSDEGENSPVTLKDLEKLSQSFKVEIQDAISQEFQSVKSETTNRIKYLESATERLERNEKKNNVIIVGLQEQDFEGFAQRDKIIEDLSNRLKVPKIDYDYAVRVGKKIPNQDRRLLVRFVRHRDKMSIMAAARQLEGTKIYINHDLTLQQRKYQALLRRKKADILKIYPQAKCRIQQGKMIVDKGGRMEVIYGDTLDDIAEMDQ